MGTVPEAPEEPFVKHAPQKSVEAHADYPVVTVGELIERLKEFPEDYEILLYPKYHTPIGKFNMTRFHLEGGVNEGEDRRDGVLHRYVRIMF